MDKLKLQAQQLKDLNSPYLEYMHGPLSNVGLAPLPPEHTQKDHIAIVSSAEDFQRAKSAGASIIIGVAKSLPSEQIADICIFRTVSASAALALTLPFFERKLNSFFSGIHPTAAIDSTAKVHPSARIGAYCVVGSGAQIGANSYLGSHVVIEANASIGENCILHSQVVVGYECNIGNRCEIHFHTSIGSDGFGFLQTPDGKQIKIPQIGKVIIEDDVEIGANCAIDRATLHETRIRAGTKMDNFCHIAHNCDIGGDGAYAGGFMTSGSAKLGSRCMTGGGVHVAGHIEVTDGVVMGARTGVTKSIDKPGMYLGFPMQPYKEGAKTLANIGHLNEMRKQLHDLQKAVTELLEKKPN